MIQGSENITGVKEKTMPGCENNSALKENNTKARENITRCKENIIGCKEIISATSEIKSAACENYYAMSENYSTPSAKNTHTAYYGLQPKHINFRKGVEMIYIMFIFKPLKTKQYELPPYNKARTKQLKEPLDELLFTKSWVPRPN